MPATGDTIDQRIPCDCGEGYWRYPVFGTGLTVVKRRCPTCGDQKWVALRGDELVGVTTVLGLDTGSLRDALSTLDGLSGAEVDVLCRAARVYAQDAA